MARAAHRKKHNTGSLPLSCLVSSLLLFIYLFLYLLEQTDQIHCSSRHRGYCRHYIFCTGSDVKPVYAEMHLPWTHRMAVPGMREPENASCPFAWKSERSMASQCIVAYFTSNAYSHGMAWNKSQAISQSIYASSFDPCCSHRSDSNIAVVGFQECLMLNVQCLIIWLHRALISH